MVKDIKKILERPRESVSDKKMPPPPKKNQKKGTKEIEMYTCTNCYSKVPADATMCLGCGSVFEEEEEIAQQSDAQEEQIQAHSSSEEEEIARILDSRNRQIHAHSDAEEEETAQPPELKEQHAPSDMGEEQMTQPSDSQYLQIPDLSDIEEEMAQPPDSEEQHAPSDMGEEQMTLPSDSQDLQMPDLSDIEEEMAQPPELEEQHVPAPSDTGKRRLVSPEIYSTGYSPQEQETQYPEEGMKPPPFDSRGNRELNAKQKIVKALNEYNKRRKNRYLYGVVFLGLSIVLFVLLWLVAVYQVLAIETDSWFGADIILLLVGAAIFFVFGFYLLLTYPESSLADVFLSLSEERRT